MVSAVAVLYYKKERKKYMQNIFTVNIATLYLVPADTGIPKHSCNLENLKQNQSKYIHRQHDTLMYASEV